MHKNNVNRLYQMIDSPSTTLSHNLLASVIQSHFRIKLSF